MNVFYLYISRSAWIGEGDCYAIGISKNVRRRNYGRVMDTFYCLRIGTRKQAEHVERRVVRWADANYDRATVKFGESGMRGKDWWTVKEDINHVGHFAITAMSHAKHAREQLFKRSDYYAKEK